MYTRSKMAQKAKKKDEDHFIHLYTMQSNACKNFFDLDRLLKNFNEDIKLTEKPKELQDNLGEVYEITCHSAIKVITVVTAIINDPEKWMEGRMFYFLIRRNIKGKRADIMFRLKAKPTKNQPGNGEVSVMLFEDKKFKTHGKRSYERIIKKLNGKIHTYPETFSERMQMLFKDNSKIPQVNSYEIAETYFLLLFEIARRLSNINRNEKTKEAQQFDDLPIGSVVARIINFLAGIGKNVKWSKKSKFVFDCFTKQTPGQREAIIKAINRLNRNLVGMIEIQSLCEKELEETYCGPSSTDCNRDWSLCKHLLKDERWHWNGDARAIEKIAQDNNVECKRSSNNKGKNESKNGKNYNNKQTMTIERDEKKKGWMLNFGRDGSSVKEKIINSIKEGSNEVQDCLSLRSYQLYWGNTLNSLKIFVYQFIEKGGKWSTTESDGEKFESNKLTIICDKKQWKLSFQGENGNEMVDKVIELEKSVNGDNTPLEILAKRLKLRNFVLHDVKGDRGCFFRTVAHQIYGTEENHKCIRMAGINHIQRFPRNFVDLMKEPLEDYIKRMSRDEEQCDEIIIKAVASATNSIVEIFKRDNSDPHCVFYPEKPRKIVVGDVDDNHYVSVDQINKNNVNI